MINKLDSNIEIQQGEPEEITNGLDPRLQEVILKSRDGIPLDASFSHQEVGKEILVDVLARLKFPDRSVAGLKVIRKIGTIVTGQVLVSDIEMVRANQNVESLKLAEKLRPELEFSVNEINATPEQMGTELPTGTPTFDGNGVIIGIVDYGCDFRHNNFRNADGSTRLLFLWDQEGDRSSLSPQPYNYGREFNSSAINSALRTTNPYAALAYDPDMGAHGTHVMDIAAGNGAATGFAGVAPQADLIFVHLHHGDIDLIEPPEERERPDGRQTSSFGNSKMLLEAVDYIFEKARELGRPAVVNMSVGSHGGPHDGSTLAEIGFDELLNEPNRAIVISAGNSHDDRSHAQGNVTDSSPRVLTWQIHPEDDTGNELEIWYDGDQELEVALETPSGQRLNPVRLGTTVTLQSMGTVVGRIIHRASDPGNGDNHIDIILAASLPGGDWKVHVSGTSTENVHFHAWIERDFPNPFAPNRQSRFAEVDNDSSFTIGSISCGERTIAVGSYLSGVPDHEISPFSAAGPTRNGREKPEVSAPGQFLHPFWEQGILAARSRTQGSIRIPGTSMASPHVAGVIALLMQAANRDLTIDEIRQAILTTARKSNPTLGIGWHPRYGFGRVDAIASILKVLPATIVPTLIAPHAVATTGLSSNGSVLEEMVLTAAKAAQSSRSKIKIQIEVEPT
ncbi:MAG: S8 family peptidase [Xenococcus sp. MO_188.B8]|nr:S8 family peptidase [Xenococcus sp. MO_188.B8]